MLGMGLSLTIEDFRQVVVHPKSLITGLICQMVLMPLVAFAITLIVEFPPEIKVGFIIIAICPCMHHPTQFSPHHDITTCYNFSPRIHIAYHSNVPHKRDTITGTKRATE